MQDRIVRIGPEDRIVRISPHLAKKASLIDFVRTSPHLAKKTTLTDFVRTSLHYPIKAYFDHNNLNNSALSFIVTFNLSLSIKVCHQTLLFLIHIMGPKIADSCG